MSNTATILRSRKATSTNGIGQASTLPLYSTGSNLHSSIAGSKAFSSRRQSQMSQWWLNAFLYVALTLLLLVGGYFSLGLVRQPRVHPPFNTAKPAAHHSHLPPHQQQQALDRSSTFLANYKYAQPTVEGTIYDIIIAGSGPAGLTAALFGSRAGLDVLVLGSETGLLSGTKQLDNFPSSPNTNGPEWLKTTKEQAISFGAKFSTPGTLATGILVPRPSTSSSASTHGGFFTLPTTAASAQEHEVHGRAIIVASGATPRQLNLPHETELWGQSIHNCAICDGHLYRDKQVLVVGGGDAALDAVNLLARYAKKVYLVHRRMEFSAKNQAAIDVAKTTENIEIIQPYVVKGWEMNLGAADQLTGARIVKVSESDVGDRDKEEEVIVEVDGAFVMIGASPNTGWLNGTLRLDEQGLVELGGSATQASFPGVFAVGEVSDTIYKQAITAAAAGAQAAIDAERWLREAHGVRRHVVAAKQVEVAKESPQEAQQADTHKESTDCDLTKAECIEQVVNKYPVVVFSKSWCPFCRKAREALAAAGIPEPFVVDLTENDKAVSIQSTLMGMTGRRTVPNIFIGGKSIGGGDETVALQKRGELVPLLVQNGALPAPQGEVAREAKEVHESKEGCDMLEESCIREIIQKYPVVMFSLEWCPECKRTLELLASLGAKVPHIVDLDDYKKISLDIRYHMLTISGRKSVPNLFIGGEFVGGFKQTTKLNEEGKLIPMLEEVGWITETDEGHTEQ